MNELRYGLALLIVVSFPGAILTWFLLHGFIAHWRRLGPKITYSVVVVLTIASWVAMFQLREPLLRIEFGTHLGTLIAGGVIYACAASIEIRCWRHLDLKTVIGVPEIAPDTTPGPLFQEGIYGRMRHPRYLAWTLGLLAFALVTNHLALYVFALLFVPTIYAITLLEERELVGRFGQEYVDYQARVPRFLPRLGRSGN